MIGDLHCHSKLSDGSMGLDDLIFYAKRSGLDFAAITDHDTMDGVMRAVILGKRYGITVIPAVEISAYDESYAEVASLLCYLPAKPDRIQGILTANLKVREKAGRDMIEKVRVYYPVTVEHIEKYAVGSRSVYPCHIMQALADLGYSHSGGEFYDSLFGKDGFCRSRPRFRELREVAGMVRSAGGIAVMPYPGCKGGRELVTRLAGQGLIQGIEVWHPDANDSDSKELQALADELGLLKTGGSNFHGSWARSVNPLASSVTDDESLRKLFAFAS